MSDSIGKLGSNLISSVKGQIAELTNHGLLSAIEADSPGWWLARRVLPQEPVGDVDHVMATGSHLVCVETKSSWQGQAQIDQAASAAKALGRSYPDTPWISILCVQELSEQGVYYASDGNEVVVCGPTELTTVVHTRVRTDPGFDPERAPDLAQKLRIARQADSITAAAMVSCLQTLPEPEWILIKDFHAFGDGNSIPFVAAGPKGFFVCEAVGEDEEISANVLAGNCAKLAGFAADVSCEFVPVLLQPSGYPREVLTSSRSATVWSLPGNELGNAIAESNPRNGLAPAWIRKLAQPDNRFRYWTRWSPEEETWYVGL